MGIIDRTRSWASGVIASDFKKKMDGLRDPATSRGSASDKTQRMRVGRRQADDVLLKLYATTGFLQIVANRPAGDMVRNGFEIKTSLDTEMDLGRKIQNRLDELNISEKCYDLFRYSRVFNTGAFMFIGVDQTDSIDPNLQEVLVPGILKKIDYINITDDPSQINIRIDNRIDPTRRAYNTPDFRIQGTDVHSSRLIWMVDNFIPNELMGTSAAQNVYDAIVAVDNALWSSSSMLAELSFKIFNSQLLAQMGPEERGIILSKMTHLITTQSSIALDKDESLTRLDAKVQGVKEVYDFIFDYLAGTAQMSRSVLLGKSWGVVGSDDNETQNYYSSVKQMQNEKYLKVLKKIIPLVLAEQSGEIYSLLGEKWRDVDWEVKFNPLYELSDKSKAETRFINAQADNLDITSGKASPQEARDADERYSELDETVPIDNEPPLNFNVPPIVPLKKKPVEKVPAIPA